MDKLVVSGAREHNLKDVTVEIPRDSLTVITGLSGSGKSSLAFDTIYAEGQRRYVESLSAYARQFLGQMDKPDVDSIEGLSPAISIDQKTTSRNPRSTVGTVTEIYDYLRLLWARIGHPHCHVCGRPITGQSAEQIIDQVMELPDGTRFMVMAPIVRGRKGEYGKQFEELRAEGFGRVKVNGELRRLDEEIVLDKKYKHDIAVVVDRLVMKTDLRKRLADSIETAVALADGLVEIELVDEDSKVLTFSEKFACPVHGPSLVELEPRIFSFNAPHGACPRCTGLGSQMEIDPELVVPDPTLSIGEGAIAPWAASASSYYDQLTQAIAERYDVDLDTPWEDLPRRLAGVLPLRNQRRAHPGLLPQPLRPPPLVRHPVRGHRPQPGAALPRDRLGLLAGEDRGVHDAAAVPGLQGRPAQARVPRGAGRGDGDPRVHPLPARRALEWIRSQEFSEHDRRIARLVLREIEERLQFLENVGIGYLSMDRASATLSGGEAQRIRLATQIGSSLVGVLYILDEPSIGLHQRDNDKLIATLERLRNLGNTVLVVEHDEGTMRAADHIVDMGPAAGEHGGHVVAEGTAEEIGKVSGVAHRAVPGRYAAHRGAGQAAQARRATSGSRARRRTTCRRSTSGSRSGCCAASPACRGRASRRSSTRCCSRRSPTTCTAAASAPGTHKRITGLDQLDKIISVDQSPIGRTPRSNPATYIGLFDQIRDLFSKTQEARARGYKPGRFSFNVKGGRCEVCRGDGQIKIEMHFLPDVYVPCEQCHGKRYNRETLEVRFKGKTIADVLEMPIEEALEFFAHIPKIRRRVEALVDVGLGYMRLGQPATTLSGGEAQRVKLAAELSKVATGRTMYILDEPTTGLHFADIQRLLEVLDRLVRGRQLGGRDRAQPRRHQGLGLVDRPGAGGRRRGRAGDRHRHARGGGGRAGLLHRAVPGRAARGQGQARAQAGGARQRAKRRPGRPRTASKTVKKRRRTARRTGRARRTAPQRIGQPSPRERGQALTR